MNNNKYLKFRVDKNNFAIDKNKIKNLDIFTNLIIINEEGEEEYISLIGLININNKIFTLVDLKKLIKNDNNKINNNKNNCLILNNDDNIAILYDEIINDNEEDEINYSGYTTKEYNEYFDKLTLKNKEKFFILNYENFDKNIIEKIKGN